MTWRMPDDPRIGRVALRVTDREQLTAFYTTVIGLHVLDDTDRETVLGVDDTALLVLIDAPDAAPRQPDQTGLFHTAFRVPDRAALGDVLERIEEHGDLDGAADHIVSEALYLSDPDGNGIEVYRDRPREEWEFTDDGMVKMATLRPDLAGIREAAAGNDHAPDGVTVGHVHLEVSDIEAARRFYVGTLGLNVRQAMDGALFVAADDYHHHIGMNTWNRRTEPTQGRGLAWYELVIPDDAALDAVRERCTDDGLDVDDAVSGFAVSDPDGMEIRFSVES